MAELGSAARGPREIPRIKDVLQVNIELASPDDFIPALPSVRHLGEI